MDKISKPTLRQAMEQRMLLLDGAMGTELQRYNLGGGNNDMLVLTRPDVISAIHRSYLEAGADVIETCTFNAQSISQARFGTTAETISRINAEAVRLAVKEAEAMTRLTPRQPRFVVGSVGPTDKILSLPSAGNHDVDFESLRKAYLAQMEVLVAEGVDGLLIETITDTLNAKAAILAAREAMDRVGRDVEILLSMTVADSSCRTLSGQTVEAFVDSVMHARPLSIGLNCSFGASGLLPFLRRLSVAASQAFVSVHPNAGLPDAQGRYVDTPSMMCRQIRPYLEESLVNMIGGCCGTTPKHIAEMRAMIDASSSPLRNITPHSGNSLRLAGLEPLDPSATFVNVGERCNVAGSRKFLRLIKEKNYDEALDIARRQVEDGAMMLDVNMDDALLDAPAEMETFLKLICEDPAIARVPVMIDSSDFETIEKALRCIQGKGVVNSLSLKEGEERFIERARIVNSLGAALVVMAFDEKGQAVTFDRKIEILERSYRILVDKVGMDPTDIIFDPNILTVATGMAEHLEYAEDFVKAAEWVHAHLPGARVSGGVSNLSFAFRGNNYVREAMHAVFLYHAMKRGLDMAIVNPSMSVNYEDIPSELRDAIYQVLFGRRDMDATELLVGLAASYTASSDGARTAASCRSRDAINVEERLCLALINADSSHLKEDINEALNAGWKAVDIVAGPLMDGIGEVGRRFGEGKMFLPQVVKTARTMKAAIDILEPVIKASNTTTMPLGSAGRILFATVRGDVHDIGKNIVKTVLECNNFEVVDMGVMVPSEEIVAKAIETDADIVCLSGLITPSLEAMAEVAKLMQKSGLRIPLMVGGATTSATHTALILAPLYDGPVIHMRDASQNPVAASALMDPSRHSEYVESNHKSQSDIRLKHSSPKPSDATPIHSLDDLGWRNKMVPWEGVRPIHDIGIAQLRDVIDWRYFLHAWKVRPDTPEAKSLLSEANLLLDELQSDGDRYNMRALAGFFKAKSTGDAIVIANVDGTEMSIETPRQTPDRARDSCLALCDFVSGPDEGGALRDYIGVFAVTVSEAFVERLTKLKTSGDDAWAEMLLQTVGDRLAEAAAEYLHNRVAQYSGWQGIRPAVGYPSLPDQNAIFTLHKLVDLGSVGISLTSAGAMTPLASIAGLIIGHPASRYFDARPRSY